ncbi:uncharacterized protein LOC132038491 [Lycium ferocissimum]|uniref:uncharacterized protein LOC132038491 n=1 Tax=Lycium ferocissimum TaxID=112874 RepID=UPI002815BDD2|nr:uncharacterized protein LOC132038491 [Lycium ferocissimum]
MEQDKREKDMERKMEELLEKSNRVIRNPTSLSYDDLCMHPNLDLPKGFKIPKFEIFNGTGNPKAHLRSYCDQLVGIKKNEPLIMRLFSRSLAGEAAEWFATQDIRRWLTWEGKAETFMERFRFNVEIVPESRWKAEAACDQPPICEEELVSVFIRSQDPNFYDRMLSMVGRTFSELVKMGEAIEDGFKSEKKISMFNKASGKDAAGVFRKKKEDVASISHTPSPNTKSREEPQSPHQIPPPVNYPTSPYSPVPVFYA